MSSAYINHEYITFIKTFIVNKCVSKYCKKILNSSKDDNLHEDFQSTYMQNIKKYIYDPDVWSKIMAELYTPIQYLIHLYKTNDSDCLIHTDTENVFLMKTFQEYIDSSITLQKVGPYDYQRFIASMKDPEFKNNLVTKYEEYIFENKVKNYLVYVAKLYLSIKFNDTNVTNFTDREKNEIENCINIMPFLEFLCKREQMGNSGNDWVDENGGSLSRVHKKDMVVDQRIQWIENETINYINDNMFM
uniref:Uncharacterized protein n=1 Tax=viral metagenome TaxID=1070528 RepID=A0A6C0HDD2_9ZZZZ